MSLSLGPINHLALTVAELERSVPFYDRILSFLGYRLSERQDDYVEWEGPCGWFILRPARTGSKDRPHDRYEPGLHHLAFSAETREQVDAFHRDILLSLRACSTRRRSGRNTAKATTLCSSSIPTASSSSSHTRPRKAGRNDRRQPAWPLVFGFAQNRPSRPLSSSTLASVHPGGAIAPKCAA
jgi:Glyoxalase/Bleomycin resistance protein/Dioxygenase superfamily